MTINDLTNTKHLISGYQLCASTEGNRTSAVQIVVSYIYRAKPTISVRKDGLANLPPHSVIMTAETVEN